MARLFLLSLLLMALAGCATPLQQAKSEDDALLVLADTAAHKSLDDVNHSRKAESLEPLQLAKGGALRTDTIDGRPALVAFYNLEPAYPGGHFMVYVFKDNKEVRIMPGE